MRCAPSAPGTTLEVPMVYAQNAPRPEDDLTQQNVHATQMQLNGIKDGIPKSTACGLGNGENVQGRTYLRNSTNSGGSLSSSKRRFRQPKKALELAAQASAVATKLLNGEIDLETARAYGTIARTAAQALGVEVQNGRFLKTAPGLEMDWESEEIHGLESRD